MIIIMIMFLNRDIKLGKEAYRINTDVRLRHMRYLLTD
jgi:hypothetical protein